MWTYILRRLLLMIPTLFGVTIVSFCVMQLAPGDPMLQQMGQGGQSTQTRDAFLIQKRELKLDKPLLLNTRYFTDYSQPVASAAFFAGRSREEIAEALGPLQQSKQPADVSRREFLYSIGVDTKRLADPKEHISLARGIEIRTQIFGEDVGQHGVPPAIALATDKDAPLKQRVGAIRSLNRMITNPFVFTYSATPLPEETPAIQSAWKTWWDRAQEEFPPIDPDRKAVLEMQLAEMAKDPTSEKLFEQLEQLDRDDMRFFAEQLLAPASPEQFPKQVVSAAALKLFVADPLRLDVPTDADAATVSEVATNWNVWYEPRRDQFQHDTLTGVGRMLADTQYGHLLWRLVTFDFGRAALPPREPVKEKIWNAFKVSAPLMVMAQLVIYFVAVPLGVACSVTRGRFVDRTLTAGLMLLYSVPPFVAAMWMLKYLCYEGSLEAFPMMGLESDNAQRMSFFPWLADYLWHAALPVTCLSLFSLATMAMYSRSSMLDVLNQDYIRTARAKGVSEWLVIFKHAFRNSLIPIITLFANFLPAMLGGSVLIEVLFNIRGMGYLSVQSIFQKDVPTLMGILYIDAIIVMLSMLLSDLLYVAVDPRISFEAREAV